MLKIWGRTTSINVQKVLWCADELGVAYERIEAGGKFGVVDTPEYRRANPNGLVPLIDDDGFVLWESNAIVRYLCGKHGMGGLAPADPQWRADADRWMDWQMGTFTAAMSIAFRQLLRGAPELRNAAEIEISRRKSEDAAAILDRHLEGRDYIAGAAFTMGDIPVALAAHRWLGLPLARQERPNIERWHAALQARPRAGVLSFPVA